MSFSFTFTLLLFLSFSQAQTCYLIKRPKNNSAATLEGTYSNTGKTIPLDLKNTNDNPDYTIGCDSPIKSYDGDTRIGCDKIQSVSYKDGKKTKTIYLYPVKCDVISADCPGNGCWFPAEKQTASLVLKSKTFSVKVQHLCDCTMVGCGSFRDIVSIEGSSVSFPIGNIYLNSCHSTSISVIIGGKSYPTSISSLSSDEYKWRIKYSMNRFGKDDNWSFESPTNKLCVLSKPSISFISGNGLTQIVSTSDSAQYISTKEFSFRPSSPSSPCPSFSISKTSQLNCGSIVCSQDKSCGFPLQTSSLTCFYSRTLSHKSSSSSSSSISEHHIHFVSFSVGLAQMTYVSDRIEYEIPVTTFTGPFDQSVVQETFSVSPRSCSPLSSNKVEFDNTLNSRLVKFSCPVSEKPKLTLLLNSSKFSSSKQFTIDSVPEISDLKFSVNESRLVVVSWSSVGGSSDCVFDLKVEISGTNSNQVPLEHRITSIILTEDIFGPIENDDEVYVKVMPKCAAGEGNVLVWQESVCIPTQPELAKFDCPSCFIKTDDNFVSSQLSFDITFTLRSSGVVCPQFQSNYVFFEFAGLISTLPFEETRLTYSFTHQFYFSGDYSSQPISDVSQSFRLNGFEVLSSPFLPLSFCLVPSLQIKPILLNDSYSYHKLSEDPPDSIDIKYFGIEGLFSPCFEGGRYILEYWTYSDREPQFFKKLKAEQTYTGEALSFSFVILSPQVYYYRIVGLTGIDERLESEIGILNVCSDIGSISKPTLVFPIANYDQVSVLDPEFSWNLSSETVSIRCGSSEIAFLLFELTEIFDDSSEFSSSTIQISLSLLATRFELTSDLLKLSTRYSWRLTVSHQKSSESIPNTSTSDPSTFRTVSKHCVYIDCNHGYCDDSIVSCVCHSGYRGDFCESSGLSIGVYVGIILGIVLFVCVFVAVSIFLLKRRYFVGLRMPDFSHFVFSLPKTVFDGETGEAVDSDEIEKLIRNDPSNGFNWALSLLERVAITDADNICLSMVYAYERNGEGLNLIKRLVEYEVDNATEIATLFRSNSFATKCFKVYSRIVGLPYLYRVLYPLLDKLIKEEQRNKAGINFEGNKELFNASQLRSTNLELNPELVAEKDFAEEIETNSLTLMLICQLFLSSLNRTSSFCPVEFHQLCYCIANFVKDKFPDVKCEQALSSFMFLRYFVAGLSVPETFGILPKPPSQSMRRELILVAKILSNLSINLKFGGKEEYMVPMNDFLEQNKNSLDNYYQILCQKTDAFPQTVNIPDKHYKASIEVLANAEHRIVEAKNSSTN